MPGEKRRGFPKRLAGPGIPLSRVSSPGAASEGESWGSYRRAPGLFAAALADMAADELSPTIATGLVSLLGSTSRGSVGGDTESLAAPPPSENPSLLARGRPAPAEHRAQGG